MKVSNIWIIEICRPVSHFTTLPKSVQNLNAISANVEQLAPVGSTLNRRERYTSSVVDGAHAHTMDSVVYLESEIRKVMANKEVLVGVFF